MLHHLSFEVRPGEKVGVLGRTGSGKSTLALSFFRFVEPVEGRILVDGLDISQIGLTDLRSKLTIIPREWPSVRRGSASAPRVRSFRPRALRRGPHDPEWNAQIDARRVQRIRRRRDCTCSASYWPARIFF